VTAPAELREMVDEELLNKLAEAKQELFNLRFQHVTGQLDNYSRLPQLKREVARINTILREREIEAAEAIEAAEVSRAAGVSRAVEVSSAEEAAGA
jgi:large subunit ribosomal protein L29